MKSPVGAIRRGFSFLGAGAPWGSAAHPPPWPSPTRGEGMRGDGVFGNRGGGMSASRGRFNRRARWFEGDLRSPPHHEALKNVQQQRLHAGSTVGAPRSIGHGSDERCGSPPGIAPPSAVIPGRSEAKGKGIQRRVNGAGGPWVPFPRFARRGRRRCVGWRVAPRAAGDDGGEWGGAFVEFRRGWNVPPTLSGRCGEEPILIEGSERGSNPVPDGSRPTFGRHLTMKR